MFGGTLHEALLTLCELERASTRTGPAPSSAGVSRSPPILGTGNLIQAGSLRCAAERSGRSSGVEGSLTLPREAGQRGRPPLRWPGAASAWCKARLGSAGRNPARASCNREQGRVGTGPGSRRTPGHPVGLREDSELHLHSHDRGSHRVHTSAAMASRTSREREGPAHGRKNGTAGATPAAERKGGRGTAQLHPQCALRLRPEPGVSDPVLSQSSLRMGSAGGEKEKKISGRIRLPEG